MASSDNPEGVADLQAGMEPTDPDEQCADFEAAQKTILERVDMAADHRHPPLRGPRGIRLVRVLGLLGHLGHAHHLLTT